MRSIKIQVKSGPDGVLHLSIPVEMPDQEYFVLLELHPHLAEWPPGYFEETAGSITDETFVRPPSVCVAWTRDGRIPDAVFVGHQRLHRIPPAPERTLDSAHTRPSHYRRMSLFSGHGRTDRRRPP